MKQITVISGKGGTGKTVITGSLAALAENKVMVDCDVDAANLHLLLHPEVKERHNFKGSKLAIIDEDKCTGCGKCREVCRFSGVTEKFLIDPISCEGCGACLLVCPEGAITLKEELTGEWYVGETRYGPMVYARLGIAQENSGKLVALVREEAKDIALEKKADYMIIDGPPGIGCPVIASLSGVDVALAVTEPTLSGIHDLERVIGVCEHFGIKPFICINKYDVNLENSEKIKGYAKQKGIEVLGEIPFEEEIIRSVSKGVPAVEYLKGEIPRLMANIWEKLK